MFKHVISGPAPIGRILNYVLLTGKRILKHKNGNRDTKLHNNIGSAWAIEFMVGLGLVSYNPEDEQPVLLSLTQNGRCVFESIKNFKGFFNESQNFEIARKQILDYSSDAFLIFKTAFINSAVYQNLEAFLSKNKSNVFDKRIFDDKYYKEFHDYYKIESEYNDKVRTSTGHNRVPSLIQICKFFNFVFDDGHNLIFNLHGRQKIIRGEIVIRNVAVDNTDEAVDILDDISNDLSINEAEGYKNESDIKKSNDRVPSLIEGDKTNRRYSTDSRLGKTAIEKANFVCELDKHFGHKHLTFETSKGHQYLEAHHLIPMKAQKDFPNQNLDRTENIVAICPNCHRAIHYGSKSEKIKYLKPLYDDRIEKLRECEHHIDISFDELIKRYYK